VSDLAISDKFPFRSRFVDVLGSRIHYIDEGKGQPVLFLHGNPTSSYLWRNIIPYLTPHARCIAPDLIGMGRSEKPDIPYRFADHARYMEAFIKTLGLRNLTLVLHDWGSAIGFQYAMHHEENVRGLAFMESILKPASWDQFPKGFKMGFKLFRTRGIGWFMIVGLNLFVKQILPRATMRTLNPEEKKQYAAPYRSFRSRKPLWVWPNEIPIDGHPADVNRVVSGYSRALQQSDLPKLLFYGKPGGLINAEAVDWCRKNLRNIEAIDIGPGIHYLQEDNPHLIGSTLVRWMKDLPLPLAVSSSGPHTVAMTADGGEA